MKTDGQLISNEVKSPPDSLESRNPDLHGDVYKMSKSIPEVKDKWALLPAFLKAKGLVKQHIDSFNYFVRTEIKNIVRAKANCCVTSDVDSNFYLRYLDVHVGRPNMKDSVITAESTPQLCRTRDLTYGASITVDVEYKRGLETVVKRGVEIGRLPVMLRSAVCHLHNKSEAEIQALGECPYDPGGYFIVKGTEKVVLMQEQLSKNRIIVELDYKHCISAVVQSSTSEAKARTIVVQKNNRLLMRHNSFTDDVPFAIVLKALGVESDQEALSLVGVDKPFLVDAMALALQDAHEAGVVSSNQAITWLAGRLKNSFATSIAANATGANNASNGKDAEQSQKESDCVEILHRVVLAHVPAEGTNLIPKAVILALMARKVLEAAEDETLLDDKDYLGNKRLELAGQLLALLFEDLFKRFNSDLKKQIDITLAKYQQQLTAGGGARGMGVKSSSFIPPPDVFHTPPTELITRGIQYALSSGNWNIKRFRMERSGVAQVLNRLSYVATVGMMTRVASQFEKSRKVASPRFLQGSQWGLLCPCDTPEGEACGLVKNLSLVTHITNDTEDEARNLKTLCQNLGVEAVASLGGEELNSPGVFTVFLNGNLLGVHRRPKRFVRNLRELRRSGYVGEFVSIYSNNVQRAVFISSDGGRLCRPLIIIRGGQLSLTDKHIAAIKNNKISFQDLITNGVLEWIDVNEENDLYIAIKESDVTPLHTHMEIDPLTMLGAVAGLIPYPNHNQSPRNTYQCAMGKQAMGFIGCNQFTRTDTLLYLLAYPQKQLCKTRTIDLMQFDKMPAGHNASVAIMSYSGYDIEDATILNKASLDRGYGRSFYLKRVAVGLQAYPNGTQDTTFPPPRQMLANSKGARGGNQQGVVPRNFSALDEDGIASVGEQLHDGMVYVNKWSPINTRDPVGDPKRLDPACFRPTRSVYNGQNPVYVDRVIMTSNDEDPATVKVVMRQYRRPELGDKFSSRHGQKGVIGLIVGQEDMPFSENGWCPDVVMNPHGFPSRMTVGKMLELVAGKAALLDGKLKYGSIFSGDKYEDLAKILRVHGYHYSGKEFLMSGLTGEAIPTYVFVGPIFYQRLKHMVQDKIHARGRGPRQLLTRQPTEGRSREGGLRLGEMERDCLVAYGTGALLTERLLLSSDVFVASVCGECGLMGYKGYCPSCKSRRECRNVQLPYAAKLLFQELMAMNVCPRLKLKEEHQ
eukprot:GDKJ01001131.1.p1 GENE.GDKJ01001131.1~~GDKJ01001131.1.p1  ORF type:complete len:1201 (+),score=305.88 GDKJ01001131.1:22-3624(+)